MTLTPIRRAAAAGVLVAASVAGGYSAVAATDTPQAAPEQTGLDRAAEVADDHADAGLERAREARGEQVPEQDGSAASEATPPEEPGPAEAAGDHPNENAFGPTGQPEGTGKPEGTPEGGQPDGTGQPEGAGKPEGTPGR